MERHTRRIVLGSAMAGIGIGALAPHAALGVVVAGLALVARFLAGPPGDAGAGRFPWRVGSVAAAGIVVAFGVITAPSAPEAAFGLTCLGGAVAALNWRTWVTQALAHTLALVTLAVSLAALIGHVFGLAALYDVGGMAMTTAIALVFLSVGALATPPLVGLSAIVARPSAGGVLARRILPLIAALSLGLAIVDGLSQRLGSHGGPAGAALGLVTTIVVVVAVVAWAAVVLDRIEVARGEAVAAAQEERALGAELATANEQLQEQTIELEEQATELENQIDETREVADRLEVANAALEERERRFRRVFESDMIGILFWGADGEITDANEAFLRIVGYDRDDLAHGRMQWRRMTPDEWAPADKHALREIKEQGTCTPFEKEYFRKDGTRIRVLVGASSFVSARDRGVAFVLDVAERWAAQLALQSSEARYRLLFDANPVPMWVYDRETLRFLAVNQAAIARYGFTRDEFLTMTIRDIRPPEDIPKVEAMVRNPQPALVPGPPVRHRHKDGTVFEVTITADTIVLEGRSGRLVAAQDLTELRRAHAALAASNAELAAALRLAETARNTAQDANRAKSEFLAVMSHELRTPLNAILGYGDLLSMEMFGPVTLDQRDKLSRMRNSSQYLIALIGQVLDFERIETGREQILAERAELGEFLRRTAADVEPQAMQKGLALIISPLHEPVQLTTDVAKLRQIVLNLLSNAVKFTDRGEIQLSARVLKGELEVSVRDTGMGIPPEHQDRIFDPFWQADQGLTRTIGGAGLGLTIVQRFAHLLGGRVVVESAPGHGTTFTVRVPA